MTIGFSRADTVGDLVDVEGGLVSRHIFADPGVYELELERIFARCWQYLAHESQIASPGDFVSSYIGEDQVLVVRQDDGSIAAFLNACRHRGMRICKLDSGNAAGFSCPYHGWSYDRAGRLVDVPFGHMYEQAPLDESWSAFRVAQLDTYKGLIFGTFDADAPLLADYLGDVRPYLDVLLDRREGGTEVIGGANKWVIECNWKFGAENFSQDGHHAFATHVSALIALQPEGVVMDEIPDGFTVTPGNGHGVVAFKQAGLDLLTRDRALIDYHENVVRPESARRLGAERDVIHNVASFTIFPNFSFLTGIQTIRTWIPRGPHHMEVRSWAIVDRDAPADVKAAQLRLVRATFSPSGLFEQDDGENWSMCQDTLRGHMSRKLNSNVRMGLGMPIDATAPGPGRTMRGWNEEPGRDFYRQYRHLMINPGPRAWAPAAG